MKHTSLTCVLAALSLGLNAITFYVSPGGTGSGLSWSQASGDLPAILFVAQPGDEIWVAKGTYYPTNDKNRTRSFQVPSSVKVYGGFAGNETSLQQRNSNKNTTILSGNIGLPGDHSDNSFSVVVIQIATESTLLDGFTIADGTADGTGASGSRDRCGAGLFIDGSGKGNSSKPHIQNCIFVNNYARDGAAVYVNGKQGNASPIFRNCKFQSNKADLDGGAVFNDGRQSGIANPQFIDCHFSSNTGNYGGAICNYGGKGESSPTFKNCVFKDNEAYLRGGAIYNMDVEGKALPVLNNCQFINNIAVTGQGMYTFSKPEPITDGMPTNYKLN